MTATTTEAATEALRDAVAEAIRPLAGAVRAVREAQTAMGLADHVTEAITFTAALVIAVEGLEDAAKAAAASARTVLRDRMEEVGAWNVGNETLTVALADAPRLVVVTDKAALLAARPDLFTTPEPAPDRKRISDELKRGATIEGVHLSNGGAPTLRLVTRRQS